MHQVGGKDWEDWYAQHREATLLPQQASDGSWRSSAAATAGRSIRPASPSSSCRCRRITCRSSSGDRVHERHNAKTRVVRHLLCPGGYRLASLAERSYHREYVPQTPLGNDTRRGGVVGMPALDLKEATTIATEKQRFQWIRVDRVMHEGNDFPRRGIPT